MTTHEELAQKNEMYDRTANSVWHWVVYEPVHGGWEFVNIGGQRILDFIGERARIHRAQNVIEFCCGLGATCRYLVAQYGLRVTGLDINRKQIELARAKSRANNQVDENKLTYIHTDVLTWQPTDSFDMAFVMDSLMLLPDVPQVLKKMRAVLKEGGCAVMAEMTAGPAITDRIRQLIWEYDGIITLPSSAEYTRLLTEAEFSQIEINDLTDVAVSCFQKMSAALDVHAPGIINTEGEQMFQDWRQNTDFYLNGFKSGIFQYLQIVGCNKESVD